VFFVDKPTCIRYNNTYYSHTTAIEEIKAIASALPTDQARETVVLFLFSIGFTAEQAQQIINNDTVLKNIFTN